MSTIWLALVVVCITIVGYAYLGYPLLLQCLALVRRRDTVRDPPSEWPLVTITIPVFNEEATIRAALEQILASDYPPDKRQIIVISDGCTDRTAAIVAEFNQRGVELVELPHRRGKTAAENAARHHIRGEIVVNTDASVRLDAAALKRLVASFTDPSVGVASGRDVSVALTTDTVNVGESGYVGYEMWIRNLETRIAGIVGASGCFFATRRELHMESVPDALSRDFAAPLIARERGYRSVSAADAVCFVPRAASLQDEYRRKVRTMARGLATLFYKRRLLNPWRYGLSAWMLASHKLARWLVPWALLVGTVGLLMLTITDEWARWTLGAGALLGLLALAGWLWPARRTLPRVVAVPAYVFAGAIAGLHAWIKILLGEQSPTWKPTRRDPVDSQVARPRRDAG